MKFALKAVALSALALASGAALAQKGETVRIAFMDPLSGPMANVGQNQLRSWQMVVEKLNPKNPAGVKFEVVGFDNKGTPQESLNTLKAAIDQGFRYVVQGNGSGAAWAILDAVNKHNERNPGKEIVYLNYAAVDPSLTNAPEKEGAPGCSFWHFRLDADTSMKMEALTSFMKDRPEVKKVYLINQNYAHGHQVAKYFKEAIKRKRPDVEIVGEDLHPIGQVKDFAPYVAKIKQSGADTIVTGNWGQDMTLLVKAMTDAGMKTPLFAYYAGVSGTPTALAPANLEVYGVAYNHSNMQGEIRQIQDEYKQRFNDDYYTFSTYNGINLLANAMAKVKSTDPVKVARGMEDLSVKSFAGDVKMRAADHQLQQTMFITHWQKTDAKNNYSVENTGYTFVPVKELEPSVSSTPTTCQMKRPAAS